MKTSKIIDMLTTAISGLNDTLILVNGIIDREDFNDKIEGERVHASGDGNGDKIFYGSGNSSYVHSHSILSPCADVVRKLWDELPEAITVEHADLMGKLYPHMYQDDYSKMTDPVREAHRLIYDVWQKMSDAQSAAAIYD